MPQIKPSFPNGLPVEYSAQPGTLTHLIMLLKTIVFFGQELHCLKGREALSHRRLIVGLALRPDEHKAIDALKTGKAWKWVSCSYFWQATTRIGELSWLEVGPGTEPSSIKSMTPSSMVF